MNTALAQQQPIPAWQQVFRDPSAVYRFDCISAAMKDIPTWSMFSPNQLPLMTEEYRLDIGPSNPAMFPALIDLSAEVARILPTARILVAPRVYMATGDGGFVLQKAYAVTEFDERPGRSGFFEVPTLMLSSNQSVENAYREAYRFLWMMLEEQLPKLTNIPSTTMSDIEAMCKEAVDPIAFDWLSKFPRGEDERREDYVARLAQERRAMVFTNMAMDRIGGCWDDDPNRDPFRTTHDMMFRWGLRGIIGQLVLDERGPIDVA